MATALVGELVELGGLSEPNADGIHRVLLSPGRIAELATTSGDGVAAGPAEAMDSPLSPVAADTAGATVGPPGLVSDEVFSTLLPDPSPTEYENLKEAIRREGRCDRGKSFRGRLLDGHTRRRICRELGIPFEADEVDLPDDAAAVAWIIRNQSSRRNLTDSQRAAIASDVERVLSKIQRREKAAKGGRAKASRADQVAEAACSPMDAIGKQEAGTAPARRPSRTLAAEAMGVAENQVQQADRIRKQSLEVFEMVKRGELTLQQARKRIKPEAPVGPGNAGRPASAAPGGHGTARGLRVGLPTDTTSEPQPQAGTGSVPAPEQEPGIRLYIPDRGAIGVNWLDGLHDALTHLSHERHAIKAKAGDAAFREAIRKTREALREAAEAIDEILAAALPTDAAGSTPPGDRRRDGGA